MSGQEADQDHASRATVGAVHTMASGYDGVAVCCDSPKSWRKEMAPTYKANRPASQEPMLHQLRLAQEQLRKDGFPVWQAEGFEADDVIASAVEQAEKIQTHTDVTIASSDKDLCQLVRRGVSVKSIRSGAIMGPEEVKAKFGVTPEQMKDWLCLVGDTSDNVVGVKGIGAKRATELLNQHGSLAALYSKLGDSCSVLGLTPSMFTNLKDGLQNAELARKLITLRTDVELPFEEIFKPRVAEKTEAEFEEEENDMAEVTDNDTGEVMTTPEPEQRKSDPPPPPAAAVRDAVTMAAMITAPAEWAKGLEPRSYDEAVKASKHMFDSRLFQGYGTPQAVLAIILAGRELNVGVMASLRGFHNIKGKVAMAAGLMAALILRSPQCKQFRCIKTSATECTYRAQRVADEGFLDVTFTMADAERAGLLRGDSNWSKYPQDMLVARCIARAARMVFPDVCFGLYTPEELGREDLEVAA